MAGSGAKGVAVAALALAWGCGLSFLGGEGRGDGAPEPGLRIWVPASVWWDAGAPRRLEFAIENATPRTLVLAEPDPADAGVAVFPGADALRACGVEPHAAPGGARRRIALPPGGSVAVGVDLEAACAALPPGVYRFEVDYRSPPVDGDGAAFSGALATRYGELFVREASASAAARAGSPRAARAGRPP